MCCVLWVSSVERADSRNKKEKDEVINQAIKELKEHDKPYKAFKEFCFMSGLEWGDDKFQKMRHLIIK